MDNWRLNQLIKLLEDDPSDEFINFAIAQEYTKQEEYEMAIEQYLVLHRINPNYIGLYYHLASAKKEIDDIEGALKTYEEGIVRAKKLKELHALSELQNAKMNLELEL